jgi:riboflavin kinase / FMN adenylyltransferase
MEFNLPKQIQKVSGKPVVITVGMFDGLHRGHQYFLHEFKQLADKLSLEPVLIAMYPHPRKVLYDINFRCLTTLSERKKRMHELGIKSQIFVKSTRDLLNMSALEFLKYLGENGLDIKAVAMGYNNRFGKITEGGHDLEMQVHDAGLEFYRIHPFTEKVSSTMIREALNQGKADYANQMLGYSYSVTGIVVPGNKIGRTIGFPTANIQVNASEKLIPAVGVYAVKLIFQEHEYPAMMNIGYRPTIEEKLKTLLMEVHIPEQDLELYDQEVTIQICQKIRDEKQFESLNALKYQLDADKNFIKQYFNTNFATQ